MIFQKVSSALLLGYHQAPSVQFPTIQPSAYPAVNPRIKYHSSKGFPKIFFSSPPLPNKVYLSHINAKQNDQDECNFGHFTHSITYEAPKECRKHPTAKCKC